MAWPLPNHYSVQPSANSNVSPQKSKSHNLKILFYYYLLNEIITLNKLLTITSTHVHNTKYEGLNNNPNLEVDNDSNSV